MTNATECLNRIAGYSDNAVAIMKSGAMTSVLKGLAAYPGTPFLPFHTRTHCTRAFHTNTRRAGLTSHCHL